MKKRTIAVSLCIASVVMILGVFLFLKQRSVVIDDMGIVSFSLQNISEDMKVYTGSKEKGIAGTTIEITGKFDKEIELTEEDRETLSQVFSLETTTECRGKFSYDIIFVHEEEVVLAIDFANLKGHFVREYSSGTHKENGVIVAGHYRTWSFLLSDEQYECLKNIIE